MKKLLIATRSKDKFPEIISELGELSFEFLNLNNVSALPSNFEVEESQRLLRETQLSRQ